MFHSEIRVLFPSTEASWDLGHWVPVWNVARSFVPPPLFVNFRRQLFPSVLSKLLVEFCPALRRRHELESPPVYVCILRDIRCVGLQRLWRGQSSPKIDGFDGGPHKRFRGGWQYATIHGDGPFWRWHHAG